MRLKLIEKKNDKVWLFDGGDKCIANVKMGAKLKIKKILLSFYLEAKSRPVKEVRDKRSVVLYQVRTFEFE